MLRLLAFFILLPLAARADDSISALLGLPIARVEPKGMVRIEKDAVLAKIGSKPGGALSADQVRSDIQELFRMGYFDEVEVRAEKEGAQVVLHYLIRERPVISKLEFEGNEKIDTDDLKEVVKTKQWSILDLNRVKEDIKLLQKHYEEKGYYLAKVGYEVRPVRKDKPDYRNDEVELVYQINDYNKVQIKKITFLNNTRFSDDQLKAVFRETKEGSGLQFLDSSGNFKDSAFKQDLMMLSMWYLDHGYVKFNYENPVVTVSDDKKWLFISIFLKEGEQYSMGKLDFSGDMLFSKEELASELTLTEGQTFAITKRNQDIQKLTEKYQDLGYAFVNVIPKMNVRDDTKLVDIDYSFEKGNLVYFGEINVVGNTKTYDKVIRRELRIHEGELFSGSKLRESRENVERLGYFAPGEVIFNQKTPPGKQDILNIEITVKERSTGTVTLGAGYGSASGFFFTTQISEINLFGRGQTVNFSAQIFADKYSRGFNFGFTEPYTFDTLWSSGFDIFHQRNQIPDLYRFKKLGFDIRLGHPIFEYTNFFLTYKNEGMTLEDVKGPDPEKTRRLDEGVLSSLVWNVTRDKRNNRYETTGGNFQMLELETAGIGGDKRFIKWRMNNRYYKTLIGDLVLRTSAEFGMIHRVGKDVPPSEKFFLGGPNNLKGFELFSVGPKVESVNAETGFVSRTPLGGAVEAFSLVELEYPLIREAGLKWVLFYDLGNAFSAFPGFDNPDRPGEKVPWTIRSDWGFGFRWFSPIGPLRFEWGFPFRAKEYEESPLFVFWIGQPF